MEIELKKTAGQAWDNTCQPEIFTWDCHFFRASIKCPFKAGLAW